MEVDLGRLRLRAHLVHALLTLMTLGAWGLIWWAHSRVRRRAEEEAAGGMFGFDYGHDELSPRFRLRSDGVLERWTGYGWQPDSFGSEVGTC